jgi:hypothetical protein
LDPDERDSICLTDAIGRQREMLIISEPGLYNLSKRSPRPCPRFRPRPTVGRTQAKPETMASRRLLLALRNGDRHDLAFPPVSAPFCGI